jgi:hypothetical protein
VAWSSDLVVEVNLLFGLAEAKLLWIITFYLPLEFIEEALDLTDLLERTDLVVLILAYFRMGVLFFLASLMYSLWG